VIEALRVAAEVFAGEFFSFLDVFGSKNFAGKIRFQNVLQASDFGVIEETAARANIGINEARAGRILPPMGELVAVGIEYRIEAKGLDLISLPIRRRLCGDAPGR
jgi:hypothetical protein